MHDGDTGVVGIATTGSDAYTIEFLFVRTEDGDKAAICDFEAAWNSRRSYDVNGVGASGHAGANILVESAKVIGVGADPEGFIWT